MTSLFEVRDARVTGRLSATTLTAKPGEMIAVIGPNGGGKTSLLRACAAIDGSATSIHVDGEDFRGSTPARRPRLLGYLPASRDVVWPMRIRDVVALGLTSSDHARIDELLAILELEAMADRPIDQLSTGERARALLARVLAPRPRVLLLDEPLSNLDPYWVLRLLDLFRRTAEDGAAVFVALHDIERICKFDRVLLVNAGEVRADLQPAAMLESPEFPRAFRIQQGRDGWEIRRPAGPQSSR
jgi:iron complex transport system ATP-binding protein